MKSKQLRFDLLEEAGKIVERPIERVLPESMMPYSEHIILERALPRVEDGLKPVQRRILYAMYDLRILPDGDYKKSARVVGECLGKYHPHGDQSVYDAMVRMAQDFSLRMTLVDGHGNFGSVDGDSAAAMRYTEVKLAPLALEILRDLEKNTVKWQKNFDDTQDEPEVLPGRFPNLLVNGAEGIAIGLATKIPPHNLTEVIDAAILMLENPRVSLDDLLKIVKGPDFPTGGFVVAGEELRNMYETGRGKFIMRAKADIENTDNDRQNIVITEIPYGVNKSTLEMKMHDYASSQAGLQGIQEIADESDRRGMRIVVKLKKGEDAVKILNLLMKKSDLQMSYGGMLVAIANGKPKQMGLVEILKYYIEHQRNVVLARTRYDYSIAKKRENVLLGFAAVLPEIRECVDIVLSSNSKNEAKTRIKARFELNDEQADAILDIKLQNLVKMEISKIQKELEEISAKCKELQEIIQSPKRLNTVIRNELTEIKNRYKCKRKTVIVKSLEDIEVEAFDPTKRLAKRGIVTVSPTGRVKFMTSAQYNHADRDAAANGKESLVKEIKTVEPTDTVLLFGSLGNCYKLDTAKTKETRWEETGETLSELFGAPEDETAVAVLTVAENYEDKPVYIFTRQGLIKKSMLSEYLVKKESYQAMILKEEDRVLSVATGKDSDTAFFVSSDGLGFNCIVDEIRAAGRISGGVAGMDLSEGETLVYAGLVGNEFDGEENLPYGEIIAVTEKGYARKTVAANFKPSKRGRKGVKIVDVGGIYGEKVIFADWIAGDVTLAAVTSDGKVQTAKAEDVIINVRNTRPRALFDGETAFITEHKEDI